ncbi:MAG: site-specific integrase [Syntrophorhabdales bacterium]|jgi:integrase
MAKRILVAKGRAKGTKQMQYWTGVYAREHQTRLHDGKPDVCYDICYKNHEKLVWEKVGWLSEGYSPEVADELRSNRVKAIRHGDELPGEKKRAPLFKDVAAEYVKWANESKKSARDDEGRYRNNLAPRFDDKRLDEIGPLALEKMKKELREEGLAPATVKHCLILFRQIFNKAISWGMYEGKNPIKAVKLPTVQNQRERFLSYEEADALLKELLSRSQFTHDMALISLHCGLRAGEIFNLRGQDLDFRNEIVNVADTKNKKGRKAFMTQAVKEALQARLPEKPSDFVFTDKRHHDKVQHGSATFTKVIDKLELNKGVTDRRHKVTFHTLRHTFCSWLALQGESLPTMRELMGHSSYEMLKKYTHLIPDEKRKATLNLEKAFEANRQGAANESQQG